MDALSQKGKQKMKNRMTVRHGMLPDLKQYLIQSGWILEEPKGEYEVLRARKPGYPKPLLIWDRTTGGCGYSIDARDKKVYQGWKRSRRKRGLDPDWYTEEEWTAYWKNRNAAGELHD